MVEFLVGPGSRDKAFGFVYLYLLFCMLALFYYAPSTSPGSHEAFLCEIGYFIIGLGGLCAIVHTLFVNPLPYNLFNWLRERGIVYKESSLFPETLVKLGCKEATDLKLLTPEAIGELKGLLNQIEGAKFVAGLEELKKD
jgi:hypothetical protein